MVELVHLLKRSTQSVILCIITLVKHTSNTTYVLLTHLHKQSSFTFKNESLKEEYIRCMAVENNMNTSMQTTVESGGECGTSHASILLTQ